MNLRREPRRINKKISQVLKTVACIALVGGAGIGCSGRGIQKLGNSIVYAVGMGSSSSDTIEPTPDPLLPSRKRLSREEEYYFGRAVAAAILAKMPGYPNVRINKYIQKIGSVIAAASPEPVTFGGYHFLVLDSREANALAAPDGFIFLTRGMLQIIPDEEALAAILAHEVAHVALHHGIQAISKENMDQTVMALGQVSNASLDCGQVIQQATLIFGKSVDELVTTLINRGYSRDQELEADDLAVEILQRAGYNSSAILRLLDALDQAADSGVEDGHSKNSGKGGWFSTHPATADRRAELLRNYPELAKVTPAKFELARTRRFHQQVFNIK